MRIYTGIGDAGSTRLFGGEEVGKDDLRVAAYGEVDELNSFLGLARNSAPADFVPILARIQNELFEVGGELASPRGNNQTIGQEDIKNLEAEIDRLMVMAPELRNFVLPAGLSGAAELHIARTVCRRAERAIVRLSQISSVRSEILVYMNRLSDLLFAMARATLHTSGGTDTVWNPRAKEETN